jgi:hypothetical protein
MEATKELAIFLETFGGWGLSVVLCGAIAFLYFDFKKTINKKNEMIYEITKKHHEEIVEVIKECVGVMSVVNESIERCEKRQMKM